MKQLIKVIKFNPRKKEAKATSRISLLVAEKLAEMLMCPTGIPVCTHNFFIYNLLI